VNIWSYRWKKCHILLHFIDRYLCIFLRFNLFLFLSFGLFLPPPVYFLDPQMLIRRPYSRFHVPFWTCCVCQSFCFSFLSSLHPAWNFLSRWLACCTSFVLPHISGRCSCRCGWRNCGGGAWQIFSSRVCCSGSLNWTINSSATVEKDRSTSSSVLRCHFVTLQQDTPPPESSVVFNW